MLLPRQESLDEWINELEYRREIETHAWRRRTFIARKQREISIVYESERVQYFVAAMIVGNFFIEAFRSPALLRLLMMLVLLLSHQHFYNC